jgi:hypothetical protein
MNFLPLPEHNVTIVLAGDYIKRIDDEVPSLVVNVYPSDEDFVVETENGRTFFASELTLDDVLLESEVVL